MTAVVSGCGWNCTDNTLQSVNDRGSLHNGTLFNKCNFLIPQPPGKTVQDRMQLDKTKRRAVDFKILRESDLLHSECITCNKSQCLVCCDDLRILVKSAQLYGLTAAFSTQKWQNTKMLTQ
ncbi:hypothetical protein ILYODFUR_027981 [Ilyodon furcidens]|uniref:Uncharacterized protein n=1 Tax=Ilyodon furcidens TaxID=33524 RepID=A0ABV0UNM7_9TELE